MAKTYKKPTPGVIKKLKVKENSIVDSPANGDEWLEIRKNRGQKGMASSRTADFLKREFGIDILSSENKEELEKDNKEISNSENENSEEDVLEKKSEELIQELEKVGKPMQRPKLLALLEQISKLTISALQSARGENQKNNGEKKMSEQSNESVKKSDSEPTLLDVIQLLKTQQEEIKQLKEDISKSNKEEKEELNKNSESEKEISELENKVSELKKNISEVESSQTEQMTKKDERITNLKKEVEELTKKYENIKKVREGSSHLDDEQTSEPVKKSVWAGSVIGEFVGEIN